MSELVRKLSEGRHSIEVSIRPERSIKALRECLDRGFVHIKFTDTLGGTELGISIDRERSSLDAADFANSSGKLQIVGNISVDYIDVRCIADIDLATLGGSGRLEPIPK